MLLLQNREYGYDCRTWEGMLFICRHHHIHFKALSFSTESRACLTSRPRSVLLTEGQRNPYLLCSFVLPFTNTLSHVSLAFSVQPHSASLLLQSSLCFFRRADNYHK